MSFSQVLQENKDAFKAGRYAEVASRWKVFNESEASKSLEDHEKAVAQLEYGRALQKLAHFRDAERNLELAKAVFEQKHGKESPEYCEALKELGSLYYEQRLLDQAKACLTEALSIRRKLHPQPHTDVARVLQFLGLVAVEESDPNLGLQYLDEAMEIQRECLGEKDDEYADTINDRSFAFLKQGRVEEAEAGFRLSLQIKEECLPPSHVALQCTLSNLAHVMGILRKYDGVEDMLKRASEIAMVAYGDQSPRTAVSINNLGGFYLERGNLLEAAEYFERALSIKEKALGKKSHELIKNINNLAIVYKRLNKTAQSEELSERAGDLMKAKIASNNRDIDTMLMLADKLAAEKKVDDACAILVDAYHVAVEEFGDDSLKVAHILDYLGMVCHNAGQYDKASRYLTKVLQIRKKHLGKRNLQVAKTLRILGTCFIHQGFWTVSDLLRQQSRVIEYVAGVEHQEISAFRTLYNSERDKKGANHPDTLMKMQLLAQICQRHGKFEEGEQLLEEYRQAREAASQTKPELLALAREMVTGAMTLLPAMSLLSVDTMNNYDTDDVEKAISLFERAIALQERALADDQEKEELILSYTYLAGAHAYIDLAQAQVVIERAIKVQEDASGANHWSLGTLLLSLTQFLEKQGKTEEAAAAEARRLSLPSPSREEKDNNTKKLNERMSSSISSMLRMFQGLGGTAESDSSSEPAVNVATADSAKKEEES